MKSLFNFPSIYLLISVSGENFWAVLVTRGNLGKNLFQGISSFDKIGYLMKMLWCTYKCPTSHRSWLVLRQQAAKPHKNTVMGGNHLTEAQPHPGFTSVPLLSVLVVCSQNWLTKRRRLVVYMCQHLQVCLWGLSLTWKTKSDWIQREMGTHKGV